MFATYDLAKAALSQREYLSNDEFACVRYDPEAKAWRIGDVSQEKSERR